jgi:hypothetical protein
MDICVSEKGGCFHVLDWTSPNNYVSLCGELISKDEMSINILGLDTIPSIICSECKKYEADSKYWNPKIANMVRQNRLRTPALATLVPFRASRRRYFYLSQDHSGKKFLPKDRK